MLVAHTWTSGGWRGAGHGCPRGPEGRKPFSGRRSRGGQSCGRRCARGPRRQQDVWCCGSSTTVGFDAGGRDARLAHRPVKSQDLPGWHAAAPCRVERGSWQYLRLELRSDDAVRTVLVKCRRRAPYTSTVDVAGDRTGAAEFAPGIGLRGRRGGERRPVPGCRSPEGGRPRRRPVREHRRRHGRAPKPQYPRLRASPAGKAAAAPPTSCPVSRLTAPGKCRWHGRRRAIPPAGTSSAARYPKAADYSSGSCGTTAQARTVPLPAT